MDTINQVEAQLILAMIAQKFHLQLENERRQVKADALVTLRPSGGLRMRLVPI